MVTPSATFSAVTLFSRAFQGDCSDTPPCTEVVLDDKEDFLPAPPAADPVVWGKPSMLLYAPLLFCERTHTSASPTTSATCSTAVTVS